MSAPGRTAEKTGEGGGWRCDACDVPLELRPVRVAYLGNEFTVDMPRCPRCGQSLVPEELAEGKMATVERLLEDK